MVQKMKTQKSNQEGTHFLPRWQYFQAIVFQMKILQTRQSSILLIAKGKPGLQCVLKEKVGNGNPNYALKKPKPYVSLCR